MKQILRVVIFLTSFVVLINAGISSVSANGGCVPVYGGGVQCPRPGNVLIDKKVQSPSSGVYVDNLGPGDPKYRPEQIVTFQIIVQNSGKESLNTVNITDILPQYVDFMSGPGNYDSKSKSVSWTVSNLTPASTQVYYIKGRIVHQALFPADINIVCPTSSNPQPINKVDAKSNGQTDHDESRFCIQKEVIVPIVPKAGPEHWLLSIVGLVVTFYAGNILRKKSYIG